MALSPYYAGREWPEYKFVEWPKWVDGVLCQNADEELEVLQRPQAAPAPPSEDVTAMKAKLAEMEAKLAAMSLDADGVDERAELIGQAEAHGITIDRRWGVERLKAALAAV